MISRPLQDKKKRGKKKKKLKVRRKKNKEEEKATNTNIVWLSNSIEHYTIFNIPA